MKSLSSFVNLERLTLSRVSLFDTSFQGLNRLESLELNDCNFENFKSQSFRHVQNLKVLKIIKPKNFNDGNLNECSKIRHFCFEGPSRIFESLKNDNLEILDLRFELDLNYFDGKSISGFPRLKSLLLSSDRCKIKSINLNYNFLSSLESCYVKSFQFQSSDFLTLPEFCNLKQLLFDDCLADRKLNNADLFKRLRQLEVLAIVNFRDFFTEIPSTVFAGLENLTDLSISHNGLNQINPEWFSGMQKLERLDLSFNKISHVTKEMFSHLTNLTFLILSFNQLNQLDHGVFSPLQHLEYLNISNNTNLRELRPQAFGGLDKLINLDMQNLNADFQLDVNLFRYLPRLTNVGVDERFKEMQAELSHVYGFRIEFDFN